MILLHKESRYNALTKVKCGFSRGVQGYLKIFAFKQISAADTVSSITFTE
jgi:hypothetical protein